MVAIGVRRGGPAVVWRGTPLGLRGWRDRRALKGTAQPWCTKTDDEPEGPGHVCLRPSFRRCLFDLRCFFDLRSVEEVNIAALQHLERLPFRLSSILVPCHRLSPHLRQGSITWREELPERESKVRAASAQRGRLFGGSPRGIRPLE